MTDTFLRRCDYCGRFPRIEEPNPAKWRIGCPSHWQTSEDPCPAAPAVSGPTLAEAIDRWNGRGYAPLHAAVDDLLRQLETIERSPRKGSALLPSKLIFRKATEVRKLMNDWEHPIGRP